MPLILMLAVLFTAPARASDFGAGDGAACAGREGIVEKVFSGDSLLVRFTYSYFAGIPKADDSVSVEAAEGCERLLGEANSTGEQEFSKGDGILCGQKEGVVQAAFTNGLAKVHFSASYADRTYRPINETFLLQTDACERQIAPGR